MIKKVLFLFFFTLSFSVFSQESKKNITIELNNHSILESILLIESNTDYSFYFMEEWLDTKIKLSKKFKNSSITTVLHFMFKESDLNFFVLDKKIILTKNSKIHKTVFDTQTKKIKTFNPPISKPIFVSSNESKIKQNFIQTVKIGKENRNNQKASYRLSGFVRNRNTGKPIANLILLEKNKNLYTNTNKKGYFSIKLPIGSNIIETVLSGIEKKKFRFIMYNEGAYTINLNEVSENLDEIVITTNIKKNIKQTATGLLQIKIEGIKTIPQILGERDILKAATTLPGIKSAGEGADGLNVRGGKSDQNLFLLDKSVLYNPTHFLGLFSAINPFTTNDLKIYKGSVPAEYGGRISSVFTITTKESNTTEFSGEASLGPVTSNVSVQIPIIKEKSGLLLGVRSTYSNWILKAIKNPELNNSQVSFFDLNGKYTHQIDKKNKLNLAGYYSKDSYSIASDTTNTYGNKIMSLDWSHRFNPKNFGNIALSSSGYYFDIDFDGKSNNNFLIKYNLNETSVNLKMNYLHSKTHKINYGFNSKLYRILPGEILPKGDVSIITPFSVQKEKALESALFIADQIKVSKKWSIHLGARYYFYAALGNSAQRFYEDGKPLSDATVTHTTNYKNNEAYKTYNGLSVRFSTRYFLTDQLSIKGSFNNSFQFIHRLSNTTSSSPTDTWKLSDLNIKPQEALQTSIGMYANLDNNIYEISLEGYYKSFNNILDYKVGASFLLNEHIETAVLQGPGKSYGVELLLRKNKGKLNGWLSYTYSRAFLKLEGEFLEETINNGNYFPTNFDKPHDISIVANYKLTERFSFSANFNYQTGRPITYPTGKYIFQGTEYVLYSDRNKFRIPDYYRLDLGFNMEGNHKNNKLLHSFWNFSVYNVLGRSNPYAIFFVTEDGAVNAYQSSIFATPIPTISYNFKF